jgi:hypothetical protein
VRKKMVNVFIDAIVLTMLLACGGETKEHTDKCSLFAHCYLLWRLSNARQYCLNSCVLRHDEDREPKRLSSSRPAD